MSDPELASNLNRSLNPSPNSDLLSGSLAPTLDNDPVSVRERFKRSHHRVVQDIRKPDSNRNSQQVRPLQPRRGAMERLSVHPCGVAVSRPDINLAPAKPSTKSVRPDGLVDRAQHVEGTSRAHEQRRKLIDPTRQLGRCDQVGLKLGSSGEHHPFNQFLEPLSIPDPPRPHEIAGDRKPLNGHFSSL